jgi:hypothetical protein
VPASVPGSNRWAKDKEALVMTGLVGGLAGPVSDMAFARRDAGAPAGRRVVVASDAGYATAGSTASISPRCRSRNGGSFSVCPSEVTGSSAAKLGSSVAISNRTPPGSRK